MPIEWESGKQPVRAKDTIKGHPAKCKLKTNHSTKKDGTCSTYHRCDSAGSADCIARRVF